MRKEKKRKEEGTINERHSDDLNKKKRIVTLHPDRPTNLLPPPWNERAERDSLRPSSNKNT